MMYNNQLIVHKNKHYLVVTVEEHSREDMKDSQGNTVEGNYEVYHQVHGTMEYRSDNLPSALSVAEHFNDIMVGCLYMEKDQDVFIDLSIVGKEEGEGGGKH